MSHSVVLDSLRSRYPCIQQPLNPLAATIIEDEDDQDRKYLTALWFFGTRDIVEQESPLPPSFSDMMVEQFIIDPHMIKERITSALKVLRFRNKGVLVQFWSPVVIRKRWLLTTWDQPFGIGVADEGLYSYRLKSELRAVVLDGEDRQELGPPGRVYSQKLPEWSLDTHSGYDNYGYIDFPVFEPSSDSCLGVLEIITSSSHVDYAFEVQEVYSALKKQNLKSPNVFEDPSFCVASEKRQRELDKILTVLKAVCDIQDLPLAQTWALSGYTSLVANSRNIEQTCNSFNRSCIGKVCMSTSDLPFYVRDLRMWEFHEACRVTHLEKSQGVVGRSFSSCGSWFCKGVTELDEDDYPLVPFALMSGITSCLAIYLKSLELDAAYVIEFYWSRRNVDEEDLQRLMKTVKQLIKTTSCMQLDIMSAPQVIGGLPLDWNLESSPSHITLLTEQGEIPQEPENMEEDSMENKAFSSIALGISPSVPYLEQGAEDCDINQRTTRRRRKRSESSISLEEIKKHYGKTMDEAAAILNISRSTLKRICINLGILRWPYRMGPDKNDSLIKPDQTDLVIHTSEGTFAPVFGVSSEPLATAITENSKQAPFFSNLSDDQIIAVNTVESVLIKATYESDTIKFQFGLLDGLVKLKELVATRFHLKLGTFSLKYTDEDGDMILIANDSDLRVLAFHTTNCKAVIKLSVQLIVQQSSKA